MTGLEMKYFVLKPRGDNPYAKASRQALLMYAQFIDTENPQLANDLRGWVLQEEKNLETKMGCFCDLDEGQDWRVIR